MDYLLGIIRMMLYSSLQLIGRRAISLPTTIYAEAPNIEVLYELDKVKKVHTVLLYECMQDYNLLKLTSAAGIH